MLEFHIIKFSQEWHVLRAQACGGVDQNYRLELGANREIYSSQIDAAGQIRSAGLESAKLRQAAAVIAGSRTRNLKRGRTRYAHSLLIIEASVHLVG